MSHGTNNSNQQNALVPTEVIGFLPRGQQSAPANSASQTALVRSGGYPIPAYISPDEYQYNQAKIEELKRLAEQMEYANEVGRRRDELRQRIEAGRQAELEMAGLSGQLPQWVPLLLSRCRHM
ncbi:hypothetical protein JAAARDRAFT_217294 [Jaapia argillacea MUCL 33604]|uniref:Uncharacterized protein n=1 Tax=Jaapia argillacea MUCL 33604 TaxID=933084 RepID=A0A067QAZ4_9AGAM|nr:hypothetical protein JAAARDRAFT_217294 [Jaapia argillacea MUCL 33604]